VRIVGYATLLAVAVFGFFVVRRLVRSWRDTYGEPPGQTPGGPPDAGTGGHD
jgi:hypothetical protein